MIAAQVEALEEADRELDAATLGFAPDIDWAHAKIWPRSDLIAAA
jgi:hypothetical protein